jgi:uncharacterized pyridoxal phosphate-containing UPF0001 family protein
MPLLDRFRTRPGWQHKDAEVRATAVRELPPDQQDLLAEIARTDDDPRVRRAAVKRLADPATLAQCVQADPDEGVRNEAMELLLGMAVNGQEGASALAALEALKESRHLVAAAREARLAEVRLAAMGRLTDARSLASLARKSEHPAVRLQALGSIDDAAVLLDLAMKSEHKDVALAALERITDDDSLQIVVDRGRNKAAVRRARALLDARRPAPPPPAAAEPVAAEAETQAPADVPEEAPRVEEPVTEAAASPPEPAAEALERESLCRRVETLKGEQVAEQLAGLRAAWAGLDPWDAAEAEALGQRFDQAVRAAEERAAAWTVTLEKRTRLDAMASEMESSADSEEPQAARAHLASLQAEWTSLAEALTPELDQRLKRAEARLAEREARSREEDAKHRAENFARLEALAERLEKLAAQEGLTLRDAEQGLRDAKGAIDEPGPVPGRKERDAIVERLRHARSAIFPRAQELREADEWTRWSNLPKQEELCREVEALSAEANLDRAAHKLRDLDERWKAVRQAPKEEGEALWRRFKAARDPIFAKVQAHFAARSAQEGENLKKKTALCEQAEALSASTDWIKTAEALKKLQAEWKAVGPVSRKKSQAIWTRFRTACDAFFTRRQEDLGKRKDEWAQNLARKEELCAKAEALSQSTDWEASAAEIKRLQAEWKTIGPVRRNKSDAIWNRFRAAADAFFERFKKRDSLDRATQVADREKVVAELEALQAAEEPPADLAEQVTAILAKWRQGPSAGREAERGLSDRLAAARNAIVAAHPDRFKGTDLDPEANRARMEKLVAKVEALVPAAPAADSGQSLAERLKEALANNTIAGRGEADNRVKAAIAEVEQAQTAWKRLGPVPGDAGRELQRRFDAAARRVLDQRKR